jgi:hypothetical protein
MSKMGPEVASIVITLFIITIIVTMEVLEEGRNDCRNVHLPSRSLSFLLSCHCLLPKEWETFVQDSVGDQELTQCMTLS